MGVVVGLMEPAMSSSATDSLHLLLKVAAVFRPVVTLHRGERKAKLVPGFQYRLSCQSLPEMHRDSDMCHPGKKVYDGVVVQLPASAWINMVNGIGLH